MCQLVLCRPCSSKDEPTRQPRPSPRPSATIIGYQLLLIIAAQRNLALRRAMLTEHRSSTMLGDVKLTSDMLDAGASTRWA